MLISSPHSFRCQDRNHSVVPACLYKNIIIKNNLRKSSMHFPLVALLFLCLHESVCHLADAEFKIWCYQLWANLASSYKEGMASGTLKSRDARAYYICMGASYRAGYQTSDFDQHAQEILQGAAMIHAPLRPGFQGQFRVLIR